MNIYFEHDNWGLKIRNCDSMETLFLGKFLLLDFDHNWIESYKEWALNPQATCESGNETYIEKEDDYIYIGDLFLDDPLEGPCYKLTPEEFIDLIYQWKNAISTKPNTVTITKQSGKLIVKSN